jgi:hypothetical protein
MRERTAKAQAVHIPKQGCLKKICVLGSDVEKRL